MNRLNYFILTISLAACGLDSKPIDLPTLGEPCEDECKGEAKCAQLVGVDTGPTCLTECVLPGAQCGADYGLDGVCIRVASDLGIGNVCLPSCHTNECQYGEAFVWMNQCYCK